MDSFNETDGSASRKRLAVPLVVLMLCAVAVVGAGYAYTATLTVNNNSLNGGNLAVDTNVGEFLSDGGADIILIQDKTYDKAAGTYTATVKSQAADDIVKNTGDVAVDPAPSLREGKKASFLGKATVTITNNTGKDVNALKITGSVDTDSTISGSVTVGGLIEKFLLVDAQGGVTHLEKGIEKSVNLTAPMSTGSTSPVEFNIYAVIIEGTEVASGSDIDLAALTDKIDDAKLTFKFDATTA